MYYWIQAKFTLVDETNPNSIHLKDASCSSESNHKLIPALPPVPTAIFNTVYGNNVIDCRDASIKKCIWTFRYNNDFTHRPICFEIAASNEQLPNTSFCNTNHRCDYHAFATQIIDVYLVK